MGKPTGFIEWQRTLPRRRRVQARLADNCEIEGTLNPEQLRRQAGRCMDCGVPFCHQGCPIGNLIPDYNDLVYRDRHAEAYRLLSATNNFPELTGRLCPAPCEHACTLGLNSEAVTIEQLEKHIAEHAFAKGWIKPRVVAARSGKRVAVVGSGPAGLAAADQLNQAGHSVTVFEKADRAGGLLRYGIPDFKLEKSVLDRRLELLVAEGIVFRTGVEVGDALGFEQLRRDYDAVVVAVGSSRPRQLEVPGRQLEGVVMATDYLEASNRVVAGLESRVAPSLDASGKQVIILGGGDTGSDCLGTAHRQGAVAALQIELLPEPPARRASNNPWPQWARTMRTSSSHEEGGERLFGLRTTHLTGEDGRLSTLHAVGVRFDEIGQLESTEGSEQSFDVDLLILAMGFVGPETTALVEQVGLQLDARSNVATDSSYATTAAGVFAAGDARRGQSLLVWAIHEGREVARSVDAYLRKAPSPLPMRGRDAPFE